MNVQQVERHLDSLINFLKPYTGLLNCHMVNYLTDNHWNSYIPEEVRKEITEEKQIDEAIYMFWEPKSSTGNLQALTEFLTKNESFRLENLRDVVCERLPSWLCDQDKLNEGLSIKEFMSEKKNHEVEIASSLIFNLSKSTTKSDLFVIDAGDGKGYLSSRLAMEYKLKVLGIDANQGNTENAIERNKRLGRAWNGLTQRAELLSRGIKPPRHGKKQKDNSSKRISTYKTVNQYITPSTDFLQLLKDNFEVPDENIEICLSGLHTCGNLASTCLKSFVKNEKITILCNIGCCYHLLKEEFVEDEFYVNKQICNLVTDPGFPISNFLRSKNCQLGRNARMLASQSIYRTIADRGLPNESLFYRALLEVIICERNPELKNSIQVGKIKKIESLSDYLKKCNEKLNLGLDVLTEEEINSYLEKYKLDRKFLDLFYLLRMSFAPIIEAVILLDRLLYLKQCSIEKSYLIKLFDVVISPRCFAIVAVK